MSNYLFKCMITNKVIIFLGRPQGTHWASEAKGLRRFGSARGLANWP
jgi:hypothetical protein